MYYEEEGSGDPLLLIMGITAPGSVWEKHVSFWKKEFRCLIPDNRGVGLSDTPNDPYTSRQMASDYAGLLDSMHIKTVRVVGCSMGSIIAQYLAIDFSEKVRSCVLMCPWARCDQRAQAIFQNMIACKEKLPAEEFTRYLQLLIFSKRYWDNPENVAALRNSREEAAGQINSQSLIGLQNQVAACMSHDSVDELPKIKLPVLVIGGQEDIFTPPWMAKGVAAGITGSDIHLYEGCGHAFHWEAIEDFNPRIMEWLRSH